MDSAISVANNLIQKLFLSKRPHIDAIISSQGEPTDQKTNYMGHFLEYDSTLFEDESNPNEIAVNELRFSYKYDEASGLMQQVDLFYTWEIPYFDETNLAQYNAVKDALIKECTSLYGEAKLERKGSTQNKKFYYTWSFENDQSLFISLYKENNRMDPMYDVHTIKIVHNK